METGESSKQERGWIAQDSTNRVGGYALLEKMLFNPHGGQLPLGKMWLINHIESFENSGVTGVGSGFLKEFKKEGYGLTTVLYPLMEKKVVGFYLENGFKPSFKQEIIPDLDEFHLVVVQDY